MAWWFIVSEQGAGLILYRILEEDGVFSCDPATGEITVAASLESYACREILHNAVADIDGIEATSVLVITVQDVNNHQPVFKSSPLIRLLEDAPSSSSAFHHVVAVDEDIGVNGRVKGALSLLARLSSDAWVTVRATDGGAPSLHSDQPIHVVVEKAKWRFFDKPSQSIRVLSTQPKHTLLTFLTQKDVSLLLPPRTSPFTVVDGELKARGQLTERKYSLTAFAESSTGNTDWMLLSIDVGEVERALPKIASMSCQSVTIPENQKIEGFKRIVAASRGVNGTFHIKGGNEAGQFTIDAFTGLLSCEELDRGRKKEHLLVVGLKDELNSDSCTIRVRVRYENDNPPVFLSKHREIVLRDAEEGAVVATLKAEDADEGENGRVSFELQSDPSRVLQLDRDGKMILARNIPYSSREWPIKIRIFDHGPSQSLESLWDLTVKDQRKNKDGDPSAPSFLRPSYSGFVEEGRPAGIQVLTVSTTADRDAPMTYSIVQDNVYLAFEIDPHGLITTAQELDSEIRPTPSGTFVSTITATDTDEDSILTFAIDPLSDSFAIDRYTGVVHTTAALDYEKEKAIELPIIVSDGLHQVRTFLSISVLDDNDNPPVFTAPLYDFVVPQTLARNSAIGQLIAREPSLLRSSHLFSVAATDNGSPPRRALAAVRVRAASGVAQAPGFSEKSYRWSSSLVRFLALASNSMDRASHCMITMERSSLSMRRTVSLASPLDYETRQQYTFTLSVTDAHSRSAVSTVIIHVLPVDEFAPVFTKSAHTFMIPQDSSVGSSIGSVHASDADEGRDGRVKYRLSNPGGNRVQVKLKLKMLRVERLLCEESFRRARIGHSNRFDDYRRFRTIIASSGPLQQASTIVFLEMGDLPSRPSLHHSMVRTSTLIIGLILIVFFALLLLLVICVCLRVRGRTKDLIDASKKQVYSMKRDAARVAASSHRVDIQRDSPTFTLPFTHNPNLRSIDPNRHSVRDLLSNRSQPDSGIEELLLSPQARSKGDFKGGKQENEDDRALNDLLYAPVSEILTTGPLNLSRHPHYLQTPMLPSSSFLSFRRNSPPAFQPLAEILQQMDATTNEEPQRDYVQITV